ncbi:hypothetical protein ES703_46395 [subsurface metagenome]
MDHFGVAIDLTPPKDEIPITEKTTIGHLISEINDVFDGRAKAVFENGEIVLTDSEDGTSSLTITLIWDNDGGTTSLTSLSGPAISQTNAGTDGVADLANYAPSGATSYFTLSQAAQDSKIKVDGFPSSTAVSEEQEVSLSAVPASGTFTLTYRGETTTDINWDATKDDIEDALESLSTVNTNDITVSGTIANGTTFTFASSLGNVDLLMINSSLKDGGDGDITASISETEIGSDGYISRSSNTVDDVIYGVALHLHDVTDVNGEEITLTRDIQSVKTKLNSMITAYNSTVVYLKEKTGYNDELKTAGVLMGDYIVSTIRNKIRTPLIARTSGFLEDIDSFLIPAQIGLEIDRDGLLSLDTNVFDEAIAENYMDVLAIIGADKTGSSNSNTIEFYGASSTYTTAGTYNVEVLISGGAIINAKIRLSSESAYRNAPFSGNIVTGDSTFDDNGDPVYPENGLQLSVDTSQDGTFIATVRVKQGFTGAIEDDLDRMLKTTTGSIQIDQERVKDTIENIQENIKLEERRLTQREERLIAQYARLEKTLTLLQNQMSTLTFMMLS